MRVKKILTPVHRIATKSVSQDLITTAFMSSVCVFAVEALFKRLHSLGEGMSSLSPAVLGLNVGIVWMISLFILGLTGSRALTYVLLSLAATASLVANYYKSTLRYEPLLPTDVTYLGEARLLLASAGINPWIAWVSCVVTLAILVLVATWHLRQRRRGQRSPLLLRSAYVIAGASLAILAASFNNDGNPLRRAYEAAGVEWIFWDQMRNYQSNGFVAGMLYNMPTDPMDRPHDYDEAAVEALLETYSDRAAIVNAGRNSDSLAETNVVVVLSESFSDPANLDGLVLDEDPIPFTRALMMDNPSGSLVSNAYGGGTANMEFYVLTGLSVANLAAQARTPFQSLLPGRSGFAEFAGLIGAEAHARAAIHPFSGGSYQRRSVYPLLGFDTATFEADMPGAERLGDPATYPYVSDRAVYNEAIRQIQASSDPMLLNVVTMQNHVPYEGKYPDPIGVRAAPDLNVEVSTAAGHYLRGLKHSDDALEEFVREIDRLSEPTVVVLYGDHLPPLWPELVMTNNEPLKRYETPWMIFGNIDLQDASVSGPIGPAHLAGRLSSAMQSPVTPLMAFLNDVRKEVPALGVQLTLNGEHEETSLNDLPSDGRDLLDKYRLIQYDQIEGQSPFAEEFYKLD